MLSSTPFHCAIGTGRSVPPSGNSTVPIFIQHFDIVQESIVQYVYLIGNGEWRFVVNEPQSIRVFVIQEILHGPINVGAVIAIQYVILCFNKIIYCTSGNKKANIATFPT